MVKTCTICGEQKPLTAFAHGRKQCTVCRNHRYPASPASIERSRMSAKVRRPHYSAEWRRARYHSDQSFKRHALAQAAARHRRVRQQTPGWADLAAIASFYEKCPPGHHVDHVFPLHGANMSGLHVLENLQYLPAAENCRKGNRV